MDYVCLGSTGLKVSQICLGMMSYGSTAERTWHLTQAEAEPLVKAAADGGVIFFDTADAYFAGMSEEITGRLLARVFAHRDDYVLATMWSRRGRSGQIRLSPAGRHTPRYMGRAGRVVTRRARTRWRASRVARRQGRWLR